MSLSAVKKGGPEENFVGAQEPQVEEPFLASEVRLFRSEVVLQVQFDQVVEPKALNQKDLHHLIQLYGSSKHVAEVIGASDDFVKQNAVLKK